MAIRPPQDADEILRQIRDVITSESTDLRSLLCKDMLVNALKCEQHNLDTLDLKILNRAMAEFRYAARVFKPYREIRKVSIFGSARVCEGDPYYQLAHRFSSMLADQGFMVITGGADGIMRAGIEGACPENSFGVNILLPHEQMPTRIMQDDPKLVTFRYFFTRKIFFVMEADAFALFPGGFGTHDEGFEVLTLLQTGKSSPMPLVLMELPGDHYWESWDHFVREQLLAKGYISPEDISLYKIFQSPEEAAGWIKSYYSTYHSIRQVQNTLVIRMEKELRDEHMEQLNESFGDLVESGSIARTAALPQEQDEPDLASKPRIAFAYNRKSAGRLNEMILAINRFGSSI